MVEGKAQVFRSPRRGADRVETLRVAGRDFSITRPGDPNLLLDDPYVTNAFSQDEFMPYWADLWPASRMLAGELLLNLRPTGTRALELGCGLGLAGVAGACAGLDVTMSDYDETALEYAAINARTNCPAEARWRCLAIDWRHPPALEPFPLLLAADVVYEERHIAPLLGVVRALLAPDGVCLISDPNRAGGERLTRALEGSTFSHRKCPTTVPETDGSTVSGTIHHISRRA